MDRELDLLDRGPARFDVPLEVLDLVRSGVEVTGVIAYDQVFERKANPGPPLVPMAHLFGQQDGPSSAGSVRTPGTTRSSFGPPWIGSQSPR